MTAVKDRKNGTLTLTECTADEVLKILLGLSDGKPEVIELLHQILATQEKTMAFQDDVIAKLTAEKTQIDGVKTLLETLTGIIKNNPGISAEVQAQILGLIDTNSQEVADAIAANTPGGPVVPPPPAG